MFDTMSIFIGIIIGFLVAFWSIKRTMKRSGAGNMKFCRSCPHYTSAKVFERHKAESLRHMVNYEIPKGGPESESGEKGENPDDGFCADDDSCRRTS